MKITYLELLNRVNGGTPPHHIRYGGTDYWWHIHDYESTTGNCHRLSEVMREWTTKAQTTTELIEPICDVLTEEEKQYLADVIAPVRDKVVCIHRDPARDHFYVCVDLEDRDSITLWNIMEDSKLKFEGMDGNKDYTLEELGL